ncbi:MAG: hypothetical protein SVO01_00200 [Thermotogota bacterium]|nr:hypothetical protein [Thermotogota bacterium]
MIEEFVEDIIAETKEGDTPKEPTVTPEPEPTPEVLAEPESEHSPESTPEPEPEPAKAPTIEELATQIGWNPDHKGDDAISAAEYILKSREIQDTMKANNVDLKKQLSNMNSSIEALKNHNEMVYKAELRQKEATIARLKKERNDAIAMADVDKVNALDDQIEGIQKDLNEPKPENSSSSNPDFDEWIKDNQWYLTDDEMAVYADRVANDYKGAPPARIYSIVRKKVAEVWPEKFESSKSVTPPTVEKPKAVGPTSPVEAPTKTPTTPKFTEADLTDSQKAIMKQFVGQGIMTKEQYIADIAKTQEG